MTGAAGVGGAVLAGSVTKETMYQNRVLKKVQRIINEDKKQSLAVNSAFEKFTEFCKSVREDRSLPLVDVSTQELFSFFVNCSLYAEEEIPRLVNAAERMNAVSWKVNHPLSAGVDFATLH